MMAAAAATFAVAALTHLVPALIALAALAALALLDRSPTPSRSRKLGEPRRSRRLRLRSGRARSSPPAARWGSSA